MAASAMGLPEMAEERPALSDVTISDLPLELLETILAQLALADDGHIDLNAVGVCMCVCVCVCVLCACVACDIASLDSFNIRFQIKATPSIMYAHVHVHVHVA
jgi:hypothetical protein